MDKKNMENHMNATRLRKIQIQIHKQAAAINPHNPVTTVAEIAALAKLWKAYDAVGLAIRALMRAQL